MAEPLLSSLPFKTVSDGDKLETVFRTANDTVHDADLWLSAHEQLSNTHWVVRKTYPAVSKLLYRKRAKFGWGPLTHTRDMGVQTRKKWPFYAVRT